MKCLECGWFKRDDDLFFVVQGHCLNLRNKKKDISDSDIKNDNNRCTHYNSIEHVERLMLISREENRILNKDW